MKQEKKVGVVPIHIPIDTGCVKQGEETLDVNPNPSLYDPEKCKDCTFKSICGSIYNTFNQIKKARTDISNVKDSLKDTPATPRETD